MSDEGEYANVRDPGFLGPLIGARVVEITQHDREEFKESGSRIYLHFENGYTLSFPIGDEGFDIQQPGDDDATRSDQDSPRDEKG